MTELEGVLDGVREQYDEMIMLVVRHGDEEMLRKVLSDCLGHVGGVIEQLAKDDEAAYTMIDEARQQLRDEWDSQRETNPNWNFYLGGCRKNQATR